MKGAHSLNMERRFAMKENNNRALLMFQAIEASYTREDHNIVCPFCGNEILKIQTGDTRWRYICQTEGCVREVAHGF